LNHKQNSLRYDERELDPSATIEEFSAVRKGGSRLVQRKIISGVWIKHRKLVRKKYNLAAHGGDLGIDLMPNKFYTHSLPGHPPVEWDMLLHGISDTDIMGILAG
jgi:hypothetical protein